MKIEYGAKLAETFYLAESPTLDFHCEQKNSFYSVYNAVAYYTLQYCSKKIFSAFFLFFFFSIHYSTVSVKNAVDLIYTLMFLSFPINTCTLFELINELNKLMK